MPDRLRISSTSSGHDRLAYRCAVGIHPAAYFGEHPHGVPGLRLRDVHDLIAVEHREICRLSKLVNESRQMRARPYAQHLRGGVAEPDQSRTENVLPR
jgi:hypothetical protein